MSLVVKFCNKFDENRKDDYERLYELTASVKNNYPHYKDWFYGIFLEGLKKDERTIVSVFNEKSLAGAALLEHSEEENKINTLFVVPDCRGKGVGSLLMKESIDVLGGHEINITVSGSNLPKLKGLLDASGFKLVEVNKDCYIKGEDEYFFQIPKKPNVKRSFKIK